MEWQNCPFWQTVFDGPQAHGAADGCSALQDIAGGLGLATCRPLASATPMDMAIARKAIAEVFSIISSSLDMRRGGALVPSTAEFALHLAPLWRLTATTR